MSDQHCPAGGPACPPWICDCFIEHFLHDPEQAGALHPEFYTVTTQQEEKDAR